jgi:glycosyltransferase involved in cell wall biosynthesis
MTDATHPTLSVLIPAYNEVEYIAQVVANVLTLECSLEVIVVDDGSTDGTPEAVERVGDSRVKLIRQPTNRGKTSAIERAIEEARGDIVIIQDADLEYDPAEIPFVIAPILENKADVVYGSRFLVRRAARVFYYYHYVANQVLTTLSNLLTNLNLTDVETGYKAFRREIVRGLPLRSKGFGMEIELTARVAELPVRIYEVPISYYGRTYDEGKKIGFSDGIAALWYTLYFNTFDRLTPDRRAHQARVADWLATR